MNRGPLVAAVLLLAAACGGSGEPPLAKDLAEELGCTGYEGDGQMMLTREAGSCRLDGQDVYVHTFSDSDQQQQWMDVGKAAGGGGILVKGDLWIVQVFDADLAEEIAEANDGEVVS